MTETISPPTIRLMTMIASRPDDADQAIETALQLGFVEIGDPPGQHRQLPGVLAEPQRADRHRRQRAASCASASDSLPPWRTLSTIWLQMDASPVDAIMSARMRRLAGNVTPLDEQKAEVAAK